MDASRAETVPRAPKRAMLADMITDERFFAFVKHLLHQITDLDVRLEAIEMVMRVNYATDFSEKVAEITGRIEDLARIKEYRASIDTLDLVGVIDAFEKYCGPVQ
jgi:hypothetical protein